MRKIIAATLCVATLILSGCGAPKTVWVGMRTDANGRLVSTFIRNSSGNDETDKTAVSAAAMNFRRQVKKPLKNHQYKIQVDVFQAADPLWSSEKKAR